jgi:hypothetical protein
MRVSTAAVEMASNGCRTVVRGGQENWDSVVPSKEMTDIPGAVEPAFVERLEHADGEQVVPAQDRLPPDAAEVDRTAGQGAGDESDAGVPVPDEVGGRELGALAQIGADQR